MLRDLLKNHIIWAAIFSNFLAQFIKIFTYPIVYKEFNFKRIVSTGGMPSSHTATFCGLATAVALQEGVASPLFSISLMVALLVIHDAHGIRRQAGYHAEALNEIIKNENTQIGDSPTMKQFKTLLGHTWPQIIVGAIIGIGMGFLIHYLFTGKI